MILEQQTENIVLEEGETEKVYATEIDMESIHFLKQMLSKFYSDPIGSLIRETCSNALDSHREINTKDPIIVSFKRNTQGNYEFSVEDFGIGINEETIDKILKKYGKSTKRNSNTQLGAFGLGWKSPISYTSSFYFVGRKDGVETKAMMYESEDDIKIDVLYTKPTELQNGVKVTVPVKWNDVQTFKKKIKEQLAYFEDVYFDVEDMKNDFQIIRNEHFQYSPISTSGTGNYFTEQLLHLCLDNVYYPLDFQKLGISPINIPLGLRFSLSDGIFPTPNREAIRYTKESIAVIKKKIEIVADFLVDEYNKTITDTDNIFDIIDHYSGSERDLNDYIPGKTIHVSYIHKFSNKSFLNPQFKGVKLLDLQRITNVKDSLLWEYQSLYKFESNRFRYSKNSWEYNLRTSYFTPEKTYIYTDEISKQQKDYIRDTKNGNLIFIKKVKSMPLGKIRGAASSGHDNYITILQLYNYPKSQWRKRIQEFQLIQKSIIDKCEKLDNMIIPQSWIDGRKKKVLPAVVNKQRKKKLEGEVTGRVARTAARHVSGKTNVLETITIQMKDAAKDKKLTIVCSTDDMDDVTKYFDTVREHQVRFVIFSERELKRLKDVDLHNWITMEEFKKGEHKVFRRAVTAHLIQKLMESNFNVFAKRDLVAQFSTDLGKKLDKLKEYADDYSKVADQELWNSMVELAEKGNLFDTTIYDVYKDVKLTLEKLTFMNNLLSFVNYSIKEEQKTELVKNITDLCKYYKFKVDWKNYNLPVLEEEKI